MVLFNSHISKLCSNLIVKNLSAPSIDTQCATFICFDRSGTVKFVLLRNDCCVFIIYFFVQPVTCFLNIGYLKRP